MFIHSKRIFIIVCLITLTLPIQIIFGLQSSVQNDKKIAFASDREGWPTIYEINSDGSDLHAVKPAESEAIALRPVWSPDGQFLAFSVYYQDDRDAIVYVVESTNHDSYGFTASGSTLDASPSWSPDSKQIAFVSNHDGGRWQIYTTNILTGRNQHRISDLTSDDFNPVWSPDGKHIGFLRGHEIIAGIYVMDSDGKNFHFVADTLAPSYVNWSPNGQTISYLSAENRNPTGCIINIDQTGKRCFTTLAESSLPVWSPDGKHIAFSGSQIVPAQGRFHADDIYVANNTLSNLQRLTFMGDATHDNDYPVWSPDGKQLAFIRATDQGVSIYAVNIDGSHLRQLTEETAGQELYGLAWQP